MKNYWKLLQKKQSKLDFEKCLWGSSFRSYLTETEVVDRLLAYDDELKIGYTCYQDFLYAVKTRDFDRLYALLDEVFSCFPFYYQTTIGTFKKYQNDIKNAPELSFLVGCLNV